MDMIYGHGKEALDALPLEDMPSLAPRLLDDPVCLPDVPPCASILEMRRADSFVV